jgi:hypothetical protein
MRSLVLLLLGAGAGIVATVLFFTLDPSFDTDHRDGVGGGNARLSLDESAVASLIERELADVPGFAEIGTVRITVREDGILEVRLGAGAASVVVAGTLFLNPGIVDGQLVVEVVEARLGHLPAPDILVAAIQQRLQQRLDALAGGFDYRVTAITTTDRRLTVEIAI